MTSQWANVWSMVRKRNQYEYYKQTSNIGAAFLETKSMEQKVHYSSKIL